MCAYVFSLDEATDPKPADLHSGKGRVIAFREWDCLSHISPEISLNILSFLCCNHNAIVQKLIKATGGLDLPPVAFR